MTIFARLLLRRADPRTRAVQLMASALAASAAAVLLFSAAPAHAIVVEVGAAKVGLTPRNVDTVIDGPIQENVLNEWKANPTPASFANNAGNPVVHGNETVAVYWDPTAHYHGDWQHVINTFFHEVGAHSGSLASVFSVNTQYTDTSNTPATFQSTFRGAYTDTHPYPAAVCTDPHPLAVGAITCLTDSQLREELTNFIAGHGLPKGMGRIYYLLTPPGVAVCLDNAATHCSTFTHTEKEQEEFKFTTPSYLNSLCSYHSDINPGGLPTGDANTILYAAIPWTAGGLHDGHLAVADQNQAPECQDGGFNPASKPVIEAREEIKPRNAQEQAEFNEKSPAEKEQLELQKALQAPHDQQPNQQPCPTPDGYCDTGLADLIVNQVAVEQQNVVTNPLLNAWQDSAKNEATDECRNFFAAAKMTGGVTANPESGAGTLSNQELGEHNYYLNTAFNLAALRLPYPGVPCIPGTRLVPQFTTPNPVNNGEIVGFDGMESEISLGAAFGYSAGGSPQPNYATYTWNFGDGTPVVSGYAPGAPACETPWLSPCAASVFHSFQYGGTYTVSLTVTDVGAHAASTSEQITVNGPPPPVPVKEATPGGSPSGSGAGSSPSTPGGSAPTPGPAAVTRPVATAAAFSQTLRGALRKGLLVRYSVNEQVAGRLEVLLARSTAQHLGIGGAPAFGLPPGSAPAVVIAKAVLVTTQGGRSALRIQFSKRTASRLAKMHKVTLTLRLIVRGSHAPTPTTVLTTVTLGG